MFNAKDLAAELPPARDDEPASLRDDIADELADHLHCAMQRELLGGASTKSDDVRHRVLDRFGNPAAVARRLWWDAMKEKIMAQRITAIMVSLATAACIVGCVLVWRTLVDTREAQAALLESQREAFAALATEFKAAMESANDPYGSWRPVRVKLVSEKGEPVQGRVYASGKAIGSEGAISEDVETGPDGIADFKLLPAGEYLLNVCVKEPSTCTTLSFLLGPGRQTEYEVVCPTSLPGRRTVRFEIQPPESLRDQSLYYLAQVQYQSREFAGRKWSVDAQNNGRPFFLIIDPQAKVLGRIDKDAVEVRKEEGIATYISYKDRIDGGASLEDFDAMLDYDSDVRIVTYKALDAKPTQALPDLKLLRAGHSQKFELESTPEGELVCRITPSDESFWESLEAELKGEKQSSQDVAIPDVDDVDVVSESNTGTD